MSWKEMEEPGGEGEGESREDFEERTWLGAPQRRRG